jgi:hypothetical protein
MEPSRNFFHGCLGLCNISLCLHSPYPLWLYAAQYPHDGQDGLRAFMDALEDAAGTFILAFLITFVAQLVLTAGDLGPPNDET